MRQITHKNQQTLLKKPTNSLFSHLFIHKFPAFRNIKSHNPQQYQQMLSSSQKNETSLTQLMSPLYRKLSGLKLPSTSQSKHLPQTDSSRMHLITTQYTNIKKSIDSLQNIFDTRMNTHEKQLLAVMHIEIEKILIDVQKVISEFNMMIREKNLSGILIETRNQAEFFKYETMRVFEQNKQLRNQINSLRKKIEQQEFELLCQTGAMKNMARKLAKVRNDCKLLSMSQICQNQSIQNMEQNKNKKNKFSLFTPSKKIKYLEEEQYRTNAHAQCEYLNIKINDRISDHIDKTNKQATDLKTKQSSLAHRYSEKTSLLNCPIRNQNTFKLKPKFDFFKNNQKQTNPKEKTKIYKK